MPNNYRKRIRWTVLLIVILCAYYYSNNNDITSYLSTSTQNSKRRFLSTFGDRKPSHVRVLEKNLPAMPQWLRDYISWHSVQRKYHLNDSSTKFLTVACHNPGVCGGISSRLRFTPYFIEIANKTRRVLFIKWEKYNLEDFLLPLKGGLDWRLPDGIDIGNDTDAKSWEITQILDNPKHPLHKERNLVVRANAFTYKAQNLKAEQGPHKIESYSNIMEIMFRPTRPLTKEIRKTMDSLGLVSKQYVAAHYRVLKDHHTEVNSKTIWETHRAIDCAVQAAGGDKTVPIYFAASKTKFVKYILNDSPYAQSRNPPVKVVGIDNVPRIHSDKSFLGYDNPRDLYPAFIDLWLLKKSKCVAFGHLSFGKLGSNLGGEDCAISHISNVKCPSALNVSI